MNVCSIFNEVLGPVMYGPSSSHTAAPCRIGYLCQGLLNEPLKKAVVCFDPSSSYAATYKFHCSDRGFTAGLLGIRADEKENLRAFEIAKERGIDISFVIEPQQNRHPNYAKICMFGKTDHLEVGTISTGGGMLELVTIYGFPVSVTGDRWLYFVKNPTNLPDYTYKLEEDENGSLLIIRSCQCSFRSYHDYVRI